MWLFVLFQIKESKFSEVIQILNVELQTQHKVKRLLVFIIIHVSHDIVKGCPFTPRVLLLSDAVLCRSS